MLQEAILQLDAYLGSTADLAVVVDAECVILLSSGKKREQRHPDRRPDRRSESAVHLSRRANHLACRVDVRDRVRGAKVLDVILRGRGSGSQTYQYDHYDQYDRHTH